jgi:DNA repair protein RecO (recombination protein O)
MRWTDDGIFLAGRPHGETSVIANIFTRENGRALGLVKGGRSRRLRPLLQTGNCLRVEWRARLDDQLGVFTAELTGANAASVLDDRLALAGINTLAALLQILPERDPHPALFDAVMTCLELAGSQRFAAAIVRFELRLLDELGFGLDLKTCAATGRNDELVYVSPRSGQAVSREAGAPYRDKLLPLPAFLKHGSEIGEPAVNEIAEGLAMTSYFLCAHVFSEGSRPMPRAREDFERVLKRQEG